MEGIELKGPDVEIKSINKEPVAIAIEGKDNKQEESPQPPSQDQEASTVKSVDFPNSNKENAQSSAFPALKYKVEESGDEIEQSKAPIIVMRGVNRVRDMFYHVVDGHIEHAFLRDELGSMSCEGKGLISRCGLSLIGSLDILTLLQGCDHFTVSFEWIAHLIACDYVMGIRIPFYDVLLFHLAEDLI